jgi:amidohydrolase
MQISELALKLEDYIIAQRRYFHRHPELSWKEIETTSTIAKELESMGIAVRRFSDITGVLGVIHGKKAGGSRKTVVLRADIDALPMEEKTGLSFISINNGVMHACGHDCHIAMLLGAARIIQEMRDEMSGEVRLLFQGAEETSCGAKYYIEQGVLDHADAVFGMHIWGNLDAPYFSIQPGSRMAGCDNFTITVEGVSAHGSAPHQGVDAIVAAANIIMQVQTLVSRNNDPCNPLVVSIGEIHGGRRFNIVADRVVMTGTVRTHSKEVRGQMEERLRRVVEHAAKGLGAAAVLEYTYTAGPVINNHELLNETARQAAVRLYGEDCLYNLPAMMGSEDFAYYMEKVPGVFCFLGGRNEALGYTAVNHNDCFTVDEAVLKRGAALYAQFARDFLVAEK